MNVFLFTDTATTEIYTLSLHDALPILPGIAHPALVAEALTAAGETLPEIAEIVSLKLRRPVRSEEHTSELQSRENLVCRLLLEKKKLFMIHLVPTVRGFCPRLLLGQPA